ncbi:MAG: MaoC family dehydratase [Promethearchaeota archaeon]
MSKSIKFEEIALDYELPTLQRKISQEVISMFGCGSLDFNPIHMDPVWAKEVKLFGFGKTIGHGQLTIALLTQVITNWCYIEGGRLKSLDIKLILPLFSGDTVICGGKIVAKHPRKKELSFVDLELYADNQKKKRVAVGKAQVYLP